MVGKIQRNRLFYRLQSSVFVFCAAFFLAVFSFTSVFVSEIPVYDSSAADSTSTIGVDLTIAPNITMQLSKEWFGLDTTPTVDGDFAYDTTTISVDTNDQGGYTLTMSAKTDNTSLVNESAPDHTIATLDDEASVTQSDQSDFTMNSWGYSLDTVFANNSPTFKPIPASTSAETIGYSDGLIHGATTDVTIATRAGMGLTPGVYKNNLVFTATTNYVAPTPEFWMIENMQEMNHTVCNSVPTPLPTAALYDTDGSYAPNMNYIPETTLVDSRDGLSYTVRRLADGNCWMTSDLKVGLNGALTLTSDDSDLEPGKTFNLPATADYTSIWATNYLQTSNTSGQGVNTPHSYTNGTTSYYNWNVATAGDGLLATVNTVMKNSICPKGWQLPPQTGEKSLPGLISQYGLTTDTSNLTVPPFEMVGFGYYNYAGRMTSSTSAYYHTSTMLSSKNYASVFITNSSTIQTYKANGAQIRCVAR